MKFLLVSLLLIAGLSVKAEVLSGPALATITPEYFIPGQKWIWKYYQDGALYSTEKYTVLEAAPTRVLFEMSTRLASETEFTVHHRLEVNPQKCLRAYKNPAQHIPYSFKLYYLQNGHWELVDGLTSPIPFEEKFNCNPYRLKGYTTTYFKTVDTDLGVQEIFQQRKGPMDNTSWYFNTSQYPGILAYKPMSRPDQHVQYFSRFSLTE